MRNELIANAIAIVVIFGIQAVGTVVIYALIRALE
jgi:hypothetical protein